MNRVFGFVVGAWRAFSDTVISFDMRDWILIAVVMVVIGVLCMKGNGKRL